MSRTHTFAFTPFERDIFAKREVIPPSKWAVRNIIVQDGLYAGSPVRMDVSPYMPGILDAYGMRGVEEVDVCGSLQIGKTLILYICLGWSMDYRPGTKMLSMPTKDTRDRVKKEKLVPLLRGSPVLRRQISKVRTDNIALKNGTNIWLSTAESPSQRASITVQDLYLDEEDLYGTSGSGNPVDDFKGRTRSLGSRAKILRVSQPKGDNSSSIWRAITTEVDQLFCYEVRCPACQEYRLPNLDNLVVLEGEKDPLAIRRKKLARYQCPACKWQWSDHIRDLAVQAGRWAPYAWTEERGFEPAQAIASPRAVGFHVPAVLARSVSLSRLAANKITAERSEDPKVKMQFANDDLGAPYTPVELVTDSQKILKLREEWLPPQYVPNGAVALTCGVDVQKRGFWFLVKAWMPSLASFTIDYGQLESWEHVMRLCFDTYYPVLAPGGVPGWRPDMGPIPPECLTGEVLPLWRVAMDSGGTETDGVFTRTEEVYMWIRANGSGIVHACKGASRSQTSPVRRITRERMPHNGRPIPGGLPLYLLDTNSIKTMAMSRMLNPESSQPSRLHAGCSLDLAEQLASEHQIRKSGTLVWVRKGGMNHLLDCEMLANACVDPTWTPSLPMFVLQMQQAERAANLQQQAPRKKKERPQLQRRWG